MIARLVGFVVAVSLVLTPSPINGGGTRVLPIAFQKRAAADHTRVDTSPPHVAPPLSSIPTESLRVIADGGLFSRDRLDVAGKFLGIVIALGAIAGLFMKFLKWREDRFASKVEGVIRKSFAKDTERFTLMCDRADGAWEKIGKMERRFNRHLESMEEDISTTLAGMRDLSSDVDSIFILLNHGVPAIDRRDPARDRRREDMNELLEGVDRRKRERRKNDLKEEDGE